MVVIVLQLGTGSAPVAARLAVRSSEQVWHGKAPDIVIPSSILPRRHGRLPLPLSTK